MGLRAPITALTGAFALWSLPNALAMGADHADIIATWQTETGGHITISPCGNAYCGRISKVVIPPAIQQRFKNELAKLDGRPVPDYLNKDPSLRDRPIQGLQVLSVLPTGSQARFEGTLYNPEDGNTYTGRVEVLDQNRLRIDGCVFQILCASQEWRRVN